MVTYEHTKNITYIEKKNKNTRSGYKFMAVKKTKYKKGPFDIPTCVVARTHNGYGYRTFTAAGPRLWNSLPVQLCNPDTGCLDDS